MSLPFNEMALSFYQPDNHELTTRRRSSRCSLPPPSSIDEVLEVVLRTGNSDGELAAVHHNSNSFRQSIENLLTVPQQEQEKDGSVATLPTLANGSFSSTLQDKVKSFLQTAAIDTEQDLQCKNEVVTVQQGSRPSAVEVDYDVETNDGFEASQENLSFGTEIMSILEFPIFLPSDTDSLEALLSSEELKSLHTMNVEQDDESSWSSSSSPSCWTNDSLPIHKNRWRSSWDGTARASAIVIAAVE